MKDAPPRYCAGASVSAKPEARAKAIQAKHARENPAK